MLMGLAAASFIRLFRDRSILGTRLALSVVCVATSVTVVSTAPASGAATGPSCNISQPDNDFATQVATSPRHAQMWRLYQAYFLRQPDQAGLEFWVAMFRDGTSLEEISNHFEASREFDLVYGPLDDRAFLNLVYQNVMCRNADGAGYDYWLGRLSSGELGRGELMTHFSESTEYSQTTDTSWALYQNPYEASLATDGYEISAIPGGQAVVLDYQKVDFSAGANRCSVASINGNWFFNPESANPTPTGLAIIDGQQLAGAVDREDRGVLGERIRPNGATEEIVLDFWGGYNINSNLASKDGRVLESWMGWRAGYREAIGDVSEWRWAAAGIPLINDGQVWKDFKNIPTNDYTHYTSRHSFVAFDQDTGLLMFGSTEAMTSAALIDWALGAGYEDLIKFDGGGSVEFNVQGQARVAGTPRNVPLWLGIGC